MNKSESKYHNTALLMNQALVELLNKKIIAITNDTILIENEYHLENLSGKNEQMVCRTILCNGGLRSRI